MTHPLFLADDGDTGYKLARSLRTRASASAYLNRTFGTPTNQAKWTWSAWVKLGQLGSSQVLLSGNTGSTDTTTFYMAYGSGGNLFLNGSSTSFRQSSAVYRDPSSWYHVVLAVDTTQATEANKLLLWINGVAQTYAATSAITTCGLNANGATATIGKYSAASSSYFDGYITEVNFIDGQALTPSSFGSTNALTGVWQPAPYTGTYGTNGTHLEFKDNSSLTTSSNVGLGKDTSGNGNYWTTNNISITAGVTYDSMLDVPTLTSASASNFCVFNPLDKGSALTVSNGNLSITGSASNNSMGKSSFWVTSGKWYWESTATAGSLGAVVGIGGLTFSQIPWSGDMYGYDANGNKIVNGTSSAYGSTYAVNDVIGVALDLTAGTITFYKNNVSQGAITGVSTSLLWTPFNHANNGVTVHWNMGQRPFTYTPPSGFLSLNSFNLPDAAIVKGSDSMSIALASGATIKATTEALYTGQFLEWIKDRANANNHQLLDGVRGLSAVLQSNTTAAETTYTAPSGSSVGFAWKAGASAVSNTNGSITSTVSVNASAGFSVITFNGTGAAATVGHGLGVAPAFYIAKYRSGSAPNIAGWACYHSALTSAAYRIDLNSTSGQISDTNAFNSTAPTSSVLSIGTNLSVSSTPMVAYCWTPIAGYSAFGSYTGNGSADGAFIYLGFRPKFVMIKAATAVSGGDWVLIDTARNPNNVAVNWQFPNASTAESNYVNVADILSNGFKIRATWDTINAPGATYIYMAFAENPLKHSLAR